MSIVSHIPAKLSDVRVAQINTVNEEGGGSIPITANLWNIDTELNSLMGSGYLALKNKPSINGVTVVGTMTSADLGLSQAITSINGGTGAIVLCVCGNTLSKVTGYSSKFDVTITADDVDAVPMPDNVGVVGDFIKKTVTGVEWGSPSITFPVTSVNGGTGAVVITAQSLGAIVNPSNGQPGQVLTKTVTGATWSTPATGVSSVSGATGFVNLYVNNKSGTASGSDVNVSLVASDIPGVVTSTYVETGYVNNVSLLPVSTAGSILNSVKLYTGADGEYRKGHLYQLTSNSGTVNVWTDITPAGDVTSVNGGTGAVVININGHTTTNVNITAAEVGALAAPASGTIGQVLTKTSTGCEWATITVSSHTHSISDVTDLQSTLNTKVTIPSGGTGGQVLGLVTTGGTVSWITVSSGSSDYSTLSNKPSVNSIQLVGNKTSADLGLITSVNGYTTTSITLDAEDVNAVSVDGSEVTTITAVSGTVTIPSKAGVIYLYNAVAGDVFAFTQPSAGDCPEFEIDIQQPAGGAVSFTLPSGVVWKFGTPDLSTAGKLYQLKFRYLNGTWEGWTTPEMSEYLRKIDSSLDSVSWTRPRSSGGSTNVLSVSGAVMNVGPTSYSSDGMTRIEQINIRAGWVNLNAFLGVDLQDGYMKIKHNGKLPNTPDGFSIPDATTGNITSPGDVIATVSGSTISMSELNANKVTLPAGGTAGQFLVKTAGGTIGWGDASGGGSVISVNGKTGTVVLDAEDVDAVSLDGRKEVSITATSGTVTISEYGRIYNYTPAANDVINFTNPTGSYDAEFELDVRMPDPVVSFTLPLVGWKYGVPSFTTAGKIYQLKFRYNEPSWTTVYTNIPSTVTSPTTGSMKYVAGSVANTVTIKRYASGAWSDLTGFVDIPLTVDSPVEGSLKYTQGTNVVSVAQYTRWEGWSTPDMGEYLKKVDTVDELSIGGRRIDGLVNNNRVKYYVANRTDVYADYFETECFSFQIKGGGGLAIASTQLSVGNRGLNTAGGLARFDYSDGHLMVPGPITVPNSRGYIDCADIAARISGGTVTFSSIVDRVAALEGLNDTLETI